MFGMKAKYDKAFHIDYEKSKISISHGPKMYAGAYTYVLMTELGHLWLEK